MAEEWFGEPHSLTVHAVTPPASQFDDGDLDYEIAHPPSCTQEQYGEGDSARMAWACDLAWQELDGGLASALHYSGTPITEPGTYQIQSWGRKYYVWEAGAYEYDAGISVITAPEAEGHSRETVSGPCHSASDLLNQSDSEAT